MLNHTYNIDTNYRHKIKCQPYTSFILIIKFGDSQLLVTGQQLIHINIHALNIDIIQHSFV